MVQGIKGSTPICSIDGCRETAEARGWCIKHYRRWQYHGDPLGKWNEAKAVEKRFWARVDKNGPPPGTDTLAAGLGPCWLWAGALDLCGYGRLWYRGTHVGVHNFSYEMSAGPLLPGMVTDHLCRVRHCVNPDHLERTTHAENMRRSGPAQKTHCVNGHEFTESNTRKIGTRRKCRECERDRSRRYAERKRASK